MYKAIFFDIDGTILSFKTHEVPDSTRQALNELRKKGIKLFLATGRMPVVMEPIVNILNFDFDGYIYANGQYVVIGDEVIHDLALPNDELKKLIPYLEEKKIATEFSEMKYRYANFTNDRMIKLKGILGSTVKMPNLDNPYERSDNRTYQLAAYIYEDEEEEFFSIAPNMRAVRWTSLFADIIPKAGGKSVGIQKVLEHLGMSRDECMAFGDGGNDTEMLDYVGLGIAMGNAVDSAKAVADYITDDVDSDGIHNALKHFGMI
ncbi:MAG: Cof-type HAD-IIB family hydrolase [Tissierellia bacterium]|nr:Cof-type HAD-IIB family hydrolase [Tissierellia bacterium]